MLLPKLIPIFVILMVNWFAAAEASFELPNKLTTSCGPVELKECWCLDEIPCESDGASEIEEYIPIIHKKRILTESKILEYLQFGSPTELKLSIGPYEGIDRSAFDKFTNATRLDLSHNELINLPEFIFSKLTNLERLSLAHNGLRGTTNVFAGLGKLKSLDLSHNPLSKVLDGNCFYGLTKSCDILMSGVKSIKKIGTDAFGNESPAPVQDFRIAINDEESKSKSIHTRSASPEWPYTSRDQISGRNLRGQVCIRENSVQRVEALKIDQDPSSDCKKLEFAFQTLHLRSLGISKFEKGWYRLKRGQVPSGLSSLEISGNHIVRVTSDVVNDLPPYITWLNMERNKIERLEEGSFKHNNIFSLELRDNLINVIEDNTFKMPKLYQLFLRENRLKDTKFAATLPSSLVSLHLDYNEITEISANSFSNLKQLRYLNLDKNRITILQSLCFSGATLLNQIILSNNKITTVHPGAFENTNGIQIHLGYNNISNLEKGTFAGLANLQRLTIGNNQLTKIKDDIFDLPNLEYLEMKNNHITVIEKGAVKHLGKLKDLIISMNPIKRLENGALFGLNKTLKAYVHVEGTPIEVIQGGLFDDV